MYQFAGVGIFLISLFVCCGSSLLGKETATQSGLTEIGWRSPGTASTRPIYSAQQALTITLAASLCFGMALASVGLGFQAESRRAPLFSVTLTLLMAIFWSGQSAFFIYLGWLWMSLLCLAMVILAGLLFLLGVGARRELLRDTNVK